MKWPVSSVLLLVLIGLASAAKAQARLDPPLNCAAFADPAAHKDCEAANAGNAHAQASVGLLYSMGQGVAVDYAAALRLFRLAAGRDDADAETYLGSMYAGGRGVARDDAEAVRLFRLAADKGRARAEVDLADMYASGRGVARNDAEALRLYRLAARQGNADGMNGAAWRLTVDGGNLDEAMDWASRGAVLAPQSAALQDTIGWILFRQHKLEIALFHAERAVALEPRCASCEDHLGDILAALGRRGEARDHWRRALDLSAGGSSDPDWDRAAVTKKLATK